MNAIVISVGTELTTGQTIDTNSAYLARRLAERGIPTLEHITVADDLAEMGKRVRHLEDELAALQDARVVSADRSQAMHAAIVAAFNSAAERVESIARRLNQTVAEGNVAIG
jgi:hypothetical protein